MKTLHGHQLVRLLNIFLVLIILHEKLCFQQNNVTRETEYGRIHSSSKAALNMRIWVVNQS